MWVSHGTTESGDDLLVALWEDYPSQEKVENFYKRRYPEEYKEVGFVNWKLDLTFDGEKG